MRETDKLSPGYIDGCLRKIADGDKSALAALYECARKQVYAFSLSILKNRCDAEDATHDAFIAIWRTAGSYKSVGKPMGWIIQIAKNLCYMRLREKKFISDQPTEETLFGESPGLSPEESVILRMCIEELSDDERQIVFLHAAAGLKHREIAEILGLSLPAVLSRYNRTVKKLKNLLQERSDGE